jgi:hypothetical protein
MDERMHPVQGPVARLRRLAPRVVMLLAASALSACALIEEALNPAEPEPIAAETENPPVTAGPALPPAPRPRPTTRVARLPSPSERTQPQAAPTPQVVQPDPAPMLAPTPAPEIKLVGMSRGEATTTLGAPAEERDAAPAKIWKYAAAECSVELYFYLDVARNDFYALHYNVHDINGNGAMVGEAADRCLQRIYSEKRK